MLTENNHQYDVVFTETHESKLKLYILGESLDETDLWMGLNIEDEIIKVEH